MGLTIHQATLTTCAVTLQALKVGAKQMTQAVFRQLEEASVFDPVAAAARGQLWGRVNYYWGDYYQGEQKRPNLQIVWQLGEELRRDFICAGGYAEEDVMRDMVKHAEAARNDALFRAIYLSALAGQLETTRHEEVRVENKTTFSYYMHYKCHYTATNDHAGTIYTDAKTLAAFRQLANPAAEEAHPPTKQPRDVLAAAAGIKGPAEPPDTYKQPAHDAWLRFTLRETELGVADANKARAAAAWAEFYRAARTLPHLFIAM